MMPQYWDAILAETQDDALLHIWRKYMQRVYTRLIQVWLPAAPGCRSLKTDLFEEAVTAYGILRELGSKSIGIDVSPEIAQTAYRRLASAGSPSQCLVGDLRKLALKSGAIDHILSGSSLDHFPDKVDLVTCLEELVRVLAPGGILILTLDNPHNPVVWLRNCLPFVWLKRLRLVPYYVGATLDRTQVRQELESIGMNVTQVIAVSHVPRAPAIWLSILIARVGWPALESLALRVIDAFEVLGRSPTRYYSGYYLAIRAQKPSPLDQNEI